jgi:PTS system mannose-specific IIB component/fructoselysine and glucoselysine-specific PTS system IIB component
VPIRLFRIDDRLIHGQVVVGWAQALGLQLIVLVDDAVAEADWERELYAVAVPRGIELRFETVAGAVAHFADYGRDAREGMLVTRDVATMGALQSQIAGIAAVHIGGLHYGLGRAQKLRYVFLDADDETRLRALAAHGVAVTAQDLPTARAVALEDILDGRGGE